MGAIIEWLLNKSENFQFILYFGLLFTLMIIESVAHFRKSSRGRRWLTNFLLTVLAIVTMMILPITFISAALVAEHKGWGVFNQVELNVIVLGGLTLLLRGFISWFTHYLAHKVPLIWRVHRVHHSPYQPETDSNFSAVFPIWDILFGTFRIKTRAPQREMGLGLEEVRDKRTYSLRWLLSSPFRSDIGQTESDHSPVQDHIDTSGSRPHRV